jgi:hypothetical protein
MKNTGHKPRLDDKKVCQVKTRPASVQFERMCHMLFAIGKSNPAMRKIVDLVIVYLS